MSFVMIFSVWCSAECHFCRPSRHPNPRPPYHRTKIDQLSLSRWCFAAPLRCLAASAGLFIRRSVNDHQRAIQATPPITGAPQTTQPAHHHVPKPQHNNCAFLIFYFSYPLLHRRRKPRRGREATHHSRLDLRPPPSKRPSPDEAYRPPPPPPQPCQTTRRTRQVGF